MALGLVLLAATSPLLARPDDDGAVEEPAEPSALLVTALGLTAAGWLGRRAGGRDRPPATGTAEAPGEAEAPATPVEDLARAPKVSVVIPTYNRGRVVGEAIESVLAQTYRNLEVIVVNDGSSDDTEDRVRRLADPRVRYLKRPHAGVAAARNAGIAVSTGQLISFLDSDDLWKPDKLECEVAFLTRYPEAHAVFGDLEKVDGVARVPSFMRTTAVFSKRLAPTADLDGLLLSRAEMYRCLLEEVPVKTAALTMRREALERAGRFDESWSSSEDWEFLLRFARTGRFGYIDRPLAVIRISLDSLHRVDKEWGALAMLRLLSREKSSGQDRATRASARRGISTLVKHLSWYYLESGRRAAAAAVYVRGFLGTGDGSLLLRAAAAVLAPAGTIELGRRLLQASHELSARSAALARSLGGPTRHHGELPPAGVTPTLGR
jgi:glycosyltransferase involved in cell wall biosynthesis